MSSTLRERRKALLRDEILEATHQLMAERGYAAMSMDDLAARVGVSKPTLYNQFPTKDDLVAAMAMQLIERTFSHVAAASTASPLERLLRFLHTSVSLQIAHRTSTMQLWLPEVLDILARHASSRDKLCRVDEIIVATIREAMAAGEIDPALDVASLVRVFFAMNISPSMSRLSIADDPDPEQLADTVVEVLRRGLAPRRGLPEQQ